MNPEIFMPFLSPYLTPVVLLIGSNVFMTTAWYWHLRYKEVPIFYVILISWGLAFFEYCMVVPANRFGNAVYFIAYTTDFRSQLWKSDGTDAGTVLVKDIRPGAEEGLDEMTAAMRRLAVAMLGETASASDVAELRAALGLDRPLLVQYGHYMAGLAVGDLGTSFRFLSSAPLKSS
jgi:ELWxxDGT repeat protein